MRTSEKELVDKEIDLYKREQYLLVDKELVEYKLAHMPELNGLAKRCAQETAEYEHTYHYAKEVKGVEIAKLEAHADALKLVVEARNEVVAADTNLYESQKKEIERLTAIVNSLIEKMPTTITVNNKH